MTEVFNEFDKITNAKNSWIFFYGNNKQYLLNNYAIQEDDIYITSYSVNIVEGE